MMVFDSSAIYLAISQGKTQHLIGQYTTTLAMFELGNIIWKNSVLGKVYSQKEALELLEACELILEKMKMAHPDLDDTYRLAANCRISFYDAAYVCLAVQLKAALVTLDNNLVKKIHSLVTITPFERLG